MLNRNALRRSYGRLKGEPFIGGIFYWNRQRRKGRYRRDVSYSWMKGIWRKL